MRTAAPTLGLFLFLGACSMGCGQETALPSNTAELASHTPPLVALSTQLARVDPADELSLQVVLAPQDPNGLQNLLQDLNNPQNANYHQYMTPAAFLERFGPTPAQVESLRKTLMEHGMQPATNAQGAFLPVHALASDAEAFFQTQLYHYRAPDGRLFMAPQTPVRLSPTLAVTAINGLTQGLEPRRHVVQKASDSPSPLRQGLRTAYDLPTTLDGHGQVLSLYELDGFDPRDVNAFAVANHLAAPPVKTILFNGFSGSPGDGAIEVDLDIDVMASMAPGIQQIRVYEASQSDGLLLWNELANPTVGDKVLPGIVSSSWGLTEDEFPAAYIDAEAQIFQQMAAQGQSVFAASGDNGAQDAGTKQLAVDDPASQPYVVGVGGTSLSTNTQGAYVSESAWRGSGGGVSAHWTIPSWQQSAVNATSKGSLTMRNVPDVSADADPNSGLLIIVNAVTVGVGGTSAAAPQWAAVLALANQQRALNSLDPLGFVGPLLYSIHSTSANAFHDVSTGNNGFYPAVVGYDDVTGLGSYDASSIFNILSQGYTRNTFSTPTWLVP